MKAKLNQDQVFSLLNTCFTIMGTLLATNGSISNDLQQLIMGTLVTVATFGVSWWFNYGVLGDQITSLMRKLFVVFGTYATARGWITADQLQAWTGPVLTAASIFYSMWFYRDEPGPNLVGTTVVDPQT